MNREDSTPAIAISDWPANPFPARTRAHRLWTKSRLWMKEHLFLFQAEMLASFPDTSENEILVHSLKLIVGVYDIFASALCTHAVPTDSIARAFEAILHSFESSLVANTEHLAAIPMNPEEFSTNLMMQLNERKLYWTGRMLRMVREHKEARRGPLKAAGKRPPMEPIDAIAHREESSIPEEKPSWNATLRVARQNARLSRTAAAQRLKQVGVQITADAIKKHEEGKAKPKAAVRKGYALIFGIPENTLFPD